jgi:acylphosphatase
VIVRGRVQGVGFRVSVASRAESRGVSGWVRNRPDGAVEAVFEGEPAGVEALVAYSHEGPRGAWVEHVEIADEEPQGLASFEIR